MVVKERAKDALRSLRIFLSLRSLRETVHAKKAIGEL